VKPDSLLLSGAAVAGIAGASLFAIGKYNALVRARQRIVTETLVLDFLVQRTLHALATTPEQGAMLQEIGALALRGAVDPVSTKGASLVLESAVRLKALAETNRHPEELFVELEKRISSCRGGVLTYNALCRRGISAVVARICGFFRVEVSSPAFPP